MSPQRGYDVESRQFKLLQTVPALITFGLIFAPIWVSFLGYPQFVIYYVAFVTIFWVYRAAIFAFSSVVGYRRYRRDIKHDWVADLNALDWASLPNPELLPASLNDLKIVIFIPFYKEAYDVLSGTLEAIKNSDYPYRKNIYVVCGVEASAGEPAQDNAKRLVKEYKQYFADVQYYTHPANLQGEVQGIAGAEC